MRTRFTALFSFATLALVASVAGAQTKSTTCVDGTTSAVTGRGACSGHGGVKKAAKKATATTKKAEAATKAAAKPEAKVEKKAEGAAKSAAKSENKAPSSGAAKTVTKKAGAEVTCVDGTMSKPGRGACSGHGGVKP